MSRDKDYYNQSHCADPTAYNALRNIESQKDAMDIAAEADIKRLLQLIRFTARVFGFEVEGRITFVNTETGRIYK